VWIVGGKRDEGDERRGVTEEVRRERHERRGMRHDARGIGEEE
jgi:hypothetical protein